MEALTEHNPKVCLQPDDIEGIYHLYPRCDGRASESRTPRRRDDCASRTDRLTRA